MVFAIIMCLSFAMAREHSFDINDDDSGGNIWGGFDDLEPPYQHPWTEIPDLINMTKWQFRFNMSHHFLTGIERGVYMDPEITLHPLCFG